MNNNTNNNNEQNNRIACGGRPRAESVKNNHIIWTHLYVYCCDYHYRSNIGTDTGEYMLTLTYNIQIFTTARWAIKSIGFCDF